jgi:hypothetical protein
MKWKNTGGPLRMADGRKIKRGEVFEAAEAEIPKGFRDVIQPLDSLPKVEGRKFAHRRYPDGENPDYDRAFATQISASPILSGSKSVMDPTAWQMASKKGLEALLIEWQGKAERVADLLEKIGAAFENRKVQARRAGRPEPETMPQDLLEEKHKAEARADVTAEEIDFVRGILANRAAKEQAERDTRLLLTHGPVGSGKGDPVVEIDGQPVRANWKGDLIIDCPKSPYNKMRLADYIAKVVLPFLKIQRRPLTKKEQDMGAYRPLRGGSVKWEDLPPRPAGF